MKATAHAAFAYLSDGVLNGEWTLGSMERERVEDNLVKGKSVFNGDVYYIRLDCDRERFIILYSVGPEPNLTQPSTMIRILPGSVIGTDDRECVVTLLSWRNSSMSDENWKLICISHETEMYIIKNRIECRAESTQPGPVYR